MNINDTIRKFLGGFFDESKLGDDDNIFESGLVNSLFAMQLVTFIENQYDISINNDELSLDNFKDINSIVAFVEKKI